VKLKPKGRFHQPFGTTRKCASDHCFLPFIFKFKVIYTQLFLFFYNEPELGVGINPGMALTPLPSSIGQGSNPRSSDRELSALPLDTTSKS